MKGFEKQTYTQVPNSLFEIMSDMDECELKVVLYICRYTFGYHREAVTISTRKMADAIGMNTASVQKGAELAEKRGLIERITNGQSTTEWRAIVASVSNSDTPSKEVCQKVIHGDSNSDTQVGLNKDKEIRKKAVTGNSHSGGVCDACGKERPRLIEATHKGIAYMACDECDIRGTLPAHLRPSKNGHAARIDAAIVGGANFELNIENDCQQFLKFSPNWRNKTERELMAFLKERVRAGQTVRQFSLWYSQSHWKGKQGQPPSSKDIRETWYAAFPDTLTTPVTTNDGGLYV